MEAIQVHRNYWILHLQHMSVSCGIIETTVLIFGNILPFSSMWSIFCQLLFKFCTSLFGHLILSLVFVLCINLITSKRPVISAKLIWIQESLHVCLPRVLLNKVKKSCMAWQVQQINTASVETKYALAMNYMYSRPPF